MADAECLSWEVVNDMDLQASATVRHAAAQQRYEIRLDAELVGFADFHDRGGRRVFTHTEIAHAHRGRALAGRLIGAALDDARASGLSVVAQCSFVQRYIDQHADYADLIAAS